MEDVPSSSSYSNASSLPSYWIHDVFLSFRGEDTRHSFTDHLYYALKQKGLDVFRDSERLLKGKSISPELLKAIEESEFAVVVLSPNYATSTWCLDELAHIAECKKLKGLEILPVFYHVEPSEIRKQTRSYGEAFAEHETRFKDNMQKVEKWGKALEDIANLSGWHVINDRGESEVIQEIAKRISDVVHNFLYDTDRDLVGIDARIEKMGSYLDLRSSDVFSVGIWGMGGIGKTTLAKEVFKKIRNQFDISGFVSNVRLYSEERTIVELQKLLCGSFYGDNNINIDTVKGGIRLLKKVLFKKKVLIVLDDVEELKQLKYLAPGMQNEEDSWAPGSRLIITTRDKHTLTECGVLDYKIYEVERFSNDEALQLICQQAFKKKHAPDEFVELSKRFVSYAGGLPLAHKVLGLHLSGREADEWSEVLDRLDEDLDKDIYSVLQISFDGLHQTDKIIFLDIACFFNGEDHIRVKKILKGCGFTSGIGITNLINKSLIKIEKKKIWMHDLLRYLGWHIVRRESDVPGLRSRLWLDEISDSQSNRRLWHAEDARKVIMENTGTTAVECLLLRLPKTEEMHLNEDPLLTMHNLRLLKIYNVKLLDVQFTSPPKELRYLEWHECPLESLSSWFTPNLLGSLVELKMPNSCVKQLWSDRVCLKMLILMDLSNCQYLMMTPDFGTVPNLEQLILQGCRKLSRIHHTVGNHQKLGVLNLKGCTSLEILPQYISMPSLQTLILSGCSTLLEFPEIVKNMDTLSELYLDGTSIETLPESIHHLKGLILLNLSGCRNLRSLPINFCNSLTSLKFLYLSQCSSMDNLPDNIGCLEHLEELDACNSAIRKVPESTSLLKNLNLLCFRGCGGLTGLELPEKLSGSTSLTTLNLGGCNLREGAIPDDVGHLFSLQSLDLSENDFFTIPESISQLSVLTEMSLNKCRKLRLLPKDPPSSLKNVNLYGCPMLTNYSSSWSRIPPQKGLSIVKCRGPEIFPELLQFRLRCLTELDLSYCQHVTMIPNMSGILYLKKLKLEGCEKLSEVHPTVGHLQNLNILSLKGCIDLESLPRFIRLKSLTKIVLSGCSKLKEFPDIDGVMNYLSELHLDGTALKHLDVWKNQFNCPISINLSGCRNLLTVPIISSLKSLNLSGCKRILRLPSDPQCMEYLEEVDVSETSITRVHQSYLFLEKVQVLSFCGCKGLQLPKWFSRLTSLVSLNLQRCGVGHHTEEVLDILSRLSSLRILDLSENNLVTLPNGISGLSFLHKLDLRGNNIVSIPHEIGHLSSLQQLDLRGNNIESIPHEVGHLSSLQQLDLSGNNIESIPHEIGHLSSLQQLDLSGNNIESIPHEIGHLSSLQLLDLSGNNIESIPHEIGYLSSLQLLDLSENNFVSIPKSISRLSELTVLHLSRCSKLRSLPNNLPFNLKHVYAQECPMLNYNADTLTVWPSGQRFCFMHCNKSGQDDDQPIPDSKNCIELLCPIYIADHVYGKRPFEIRVPHSTVIPNLWRHRNSGPSVTIPLSDDNSVSMGFALFVVFRILDLQDGHFNKSWESEETICEFRTDIGTRNSLVFQNFIDFTVGSYALCCYVPQSPQYSGIYDKPSSQLQASISTKRRDLEVRGCGMHVISEEGAAEFIKCLIDQTVFQHLGSSFDQHCEFLLDEETMAGDLIEVHSTSTVDEDSSIRCDLSIPPREEFSILYKGRNGREKCFYFEFAAPITSFPPWFHNHHAGDVTICEITGNLLDDQSWVGLEVYMVFTQRKDSSCDGAESFSFCVDCCGHDHENIVVDRSLKLDSFLGTSKQLVVLHIPRIYFSPWLNQCQGISILFRSIDPELEVQVCGSRLLFERDLQDLINSLADVEDPVSQIQAVHRQRKRKRNSSYWSKRNTVQALLERAPRSSIMQLQKYSCCFRQNEGTIEYNMLLHGKGCLSDKTDSNQEHVAEEGTGSSGHHRLCIMTETQLNGSYSSEEWKRCIEQLLQYSKVATISSKKHTVYTLKHFNPSSPYNICLSTKEIPTWLRGHRARVGMRLPSKLCDDNNWKGLYICAALKVKDHLPFVSVVKLLCHLRSKDYCLNPIPMCSITEKKLLDPVYLGGFVWVTYIPRDLLSEFSMVSDIEARIHVNCPGLKVNECGIRLLYRQEEEEFKRVITGCWSSFFDNLNLIRKVADHQCRWTNRILRIVEGRIMEFDPDLLYNATLPSGIIPKWFGCPRHLSGDWQFRLPASSQRSDKCWIGLALWATYIENRITEEHHFRCRFRTLNNQLSSLHEYQMTTEETKLLSRKLDLYSPFGWLFYIPRSWFLHQLRGESALLATFEESSWIGRGAHRFVYEHDVEEFKQLLN